MRRCLFFFFSSRRRHTRCLSDWSSDVCSSDLVPFWGDWTGHVTVAFDQLRTDEHNFSHVGGAFDIGRGSIRMKGGRGGLDRHVLTNVDGSISFDAAAEFPYSVKAAAALGEIDAAPLFPPPQPGGDP